MRSRPSRGYGVRPGRVDAVVLEPEVVDRERATDGEQDRMALGGRAVVEVDDVRAAGPGRRRAPAAARTPSRTVTPSALERRPDGLGVARDGRSARAAGRTGRSSSARRTGRRPGRARSRSGRRRGRAGSPAARGRGSPRGSSSTGTCLEPLERRDLRDRPDGDDDVPCPELVGDAVVGDRHAPAPGDPAVAAIGDGAGRLERRGRARESSGSAASGRAIDHVVAPRGRPAPSRRPPGWRRGARRC